MHDPYRILPHRSWQAVLLSYGAARQSFPYMYQAGTANHLLIPHDFVLYPQRDLFVQLNNPLARNRLPSLNTRLLFWSQRFRTALDSDFRAFGASIIGIDEDTL